jgi:hypothetical protein
MKEFRREIRVGAESETVVHRVQKFVKDRSGRIGYALTSAPLTQATGGLWKLDPSFSVADSILDNPGFVSMLRVVLRDGHVIVPELKANGSN